MEADRTILIVEDDDAVRLSLRNYLQEKGYEVLVASEGVGAIRLLIDNNVDLVVTDYRMSPLGGDYWLRFLKRFCPDTPCIVVSGYVESLPKLEYPLLAKPFDYEQLNDQIVRSLGI